MRFDERVRALNALSFAVMTVFASGISMDALARLLQPAAGLGILWRRLWICSGVVLLYVLKGGLTSAIYTEVLQFFMIVLGFAPVVYLGLRDAGGWHSVKHALSGVATNPSAFYLQPAGIHLFAGCLDERVEAGAGRALRQSAGGGLVRGHLWSGIRAFIRLLVHELPGGSTRHGGQKHDRRPQHPSRCGHSQDAFPPVGHPARNGRHCPGLDAQTRIIASRRPLFRRKIIPRRWSW